MAARASYVVNDLIDPHSKHQGLGLTMPLINADRERFPCDPWNLIETRHDAGSSGVLDTLFAVGNGSLGMRGAHSTLGDAATPGTYLNGFHETWPIRHAEDAYGFARVGQGIISIPDANSFDIRVDGESLSLGSSAVTDYRRWVDFKTGTYECTIVWTCRSGAAVTTHERRAVGHDNAGTLAVELTLTSDRPATLDVTSAVVNRQDLNPDDQATVDPRRAAATRGGYSKTCIRGQRADRYAWHGKQRSRGNSSGWPLTTRSLRCTSRLTRAQTVIGATITARRPGTQ